MKRYYLILFTILAGILLLFGYFYYKYYSVSHAHYENFGIYLPEGNYVHGIDVSRYQENINWPEVQAMRSKDVRLLFCWIKATEGHHLVDKKLQRNLQEVKKTELLYGLYHFFRANVDPVAQAKLFLKYYHQQPGELPPVLDVETMDGMSAEVVKKRAKIWLETVEESTGIKPVLYANQHFFSTLLNDDRFSSYPKWVAHYRRRSLNKNTTWHFWQHNDQGRVNGISHPVDFNVFNGDSLALREFLKANRVN